MTQDTKIFCAIDISDFDQALALSKAVSAQGCGLKLGLEFFNRHGPQGIAKIHDDCEGVPIFLDLKYHDIPNTVAGAIKSINHIGVTYLNLHASGGLEMMQAAREACDPKTKLIAVTVLTSLNDDNLKSVGQKTPVEDQVKRLAELTQLAGLDGVVCPAHEIKMLRTTCGQNFVLMVPGIRPGGTGSGDDQKRIMDPKEAMAAGATHLVIGRPITQSDDPGQAAKDILDSLS